MSGWRSNRGDFNKPAHLTQREWKAMTNAQREEAASKEIAGRIEEQEKFDWRMRNEPLPRELDWLRTRLIELETRLDFLENKT